MPTGGWPVLAQSRGPCAVPLPSVPVRAALRPSWGNSNGRDAWRGQFWVLWQFSSFQEPELGQLSSYPSPEFPGTGPPGPQRSLGNKGQSKGPPAQSSGECSGCWRRTEQDRPAWPSPGTRGAEMGFQRQREQPQPEARGQQTKVLGRSGPHTPLSPGNPPGSADGTQTSQLHPECFSVA